MLDGEANDFFKHGTPFALCQTAASPRSPARMCMTPRWWRGTMAVICFIVGTQWSCLAPALPMSALMRKLF